MALRIPTPTPPAFTINNVETANDRAATATLFQAYATALNLDLSFQDFATELASLPGKYAPPTGSLLLARSSSVRPSLSSSPSPSLDTPLGCVALRPLPLSLDPSSSSSICELKRLYVHPTGRGLGVGRALLEAAIQASKRLGYARVRLDTLPDMAAARALYTSFGFVEIDQYYPTPLQGTVFMELDLNEMKG